MDQQLLLWLNSDASVPGLDIFFAWLSQTTWFSVPLFALILALLARAHGKDGAKLWLTLVAITILGDQLGGLLKYIIGQHRPCAELPELVRVPQTWFAIHCSSHLNGMPSNHAWNFFAATVFLGVLLRSWTWALALGAIALAVSLSRVYLGVHYPSQVAVGMLLGALYGLLAARVALHYAPFIARLRPLAQKTL
jgi:undecaprenyl-diphosphatase